MISLSAGDVIAGYCLDESIGRGGMGVVFRATHVALERRVAVKLIAPELSADDAFRQRFQRESRLAASIDHAHVIPVFDAGEENGQLYVAMRYVEGTDLAALLSGEGSLAPELAIGLIGQVADGLDAAHERGLVHRDVKPANILLENRPSGYHAYLTDFGLVKPVGAASGVTRTGQWLGTPDYAAPEQVLGADVDARTDVYALGCMLYQAIAGKRPFERDTEVATMFAHVSDPPPTLSDARPDVPRGLDAVVLAALAKSPDERFESARDLAEAAQAAIATPTPTVALPAGEAAPTVPAPGEDETVARRRRARWLVPALALALLAGAVALALVAIGGGDDDQRAAAAVPAGNLTGNPSFERSTSGWDVFHSEIAREQASDAPDGEQVTRVTLAAAPGEYSIDDDVETVSSSVKGRSYTASAWVKATETTDGARVCIALREGLEDGGDVPFSDASVVASASEYREVRVSHRARASGETIGVHVYRSTKVSEGEAFLVDAIALTEGGDAGAGGRQAECES